MTVPWKKGERSRMTTIRTSVLLALFLGIGVAPAGEPRTDSLGDPLPARALLRISTARLQHPGPIYGVAVSEDGKMLASYGGERRVRVWDARDGKPLWEFALPHWGPWALAFSRDGKELAAISRSAPGRKDQGDFRRWDLETGRELQGDKRSKDPFDGTVVHVALACPPDGGFVVAETTGPDISLYRPGVLGFGKTLEGKGGRVMGIDFTRDGRTLVSLAEDGVVRFWDVRDGKETVTLPALTVTNVGLKGNLAAVAVSPDAKIVAASLPDGTTRLLDAAGRELRRLRSAEQAGALAFSPAGKWLITGGMLVRKWDVATGEEIPILRQPAHPLRSLALSPDGKTVAFADDRDNLRLADVATGKTLFQRTIPNRAGIAFSPDGKRFAAAAGDNAIVFWNMGQLQGAPAAVLACVDKVHAFVFSPDGKHLATAEGGWFVRVYEVASQRAVLAIQPPGNSVFGVAFSPDGKRLATMGESRVVAREQGMTSQVVRLWDAFTGKEVPVGEEVRRTAHTVAFHPDGKTLAAIHLPEAAKAGALAFNPPLPPVEDRLETVRLWDLASARERLRFTDAVQRKKAERATSWISGRSSAEPVAFSPDGRVLAAPGEGGIVLYETATGKPRLRLGGHLQRAVGFAFTPDGKTFVSASRDSTVLIWDVTGLWTGGKLTGSAEDLWAALADADPERAGRAVWSMVDRPVESLAVLRKHLKPVPAGQDVVAKLIAQLDDPGYTVREKATRQLAELGPAVEDALTKKLRAGTSLEMSRRIEKLLRTIQTVPPTPEQLQAVRAVEVAERIGTVETRALLREWASGAAGAWLTSQARGALGRLEPRRGGIK
jgi:WD40 repeat protein